MAMSATGANDGGTFHTRHVKPLAIGLSSVAGVLAVSGGIFLVLDGQTVYGNHYFLWGLFAVTGLAYVWAGTAIVRRQPENVIGWLMFFMAIVITLGPAATAYGIYAIRVSPGTVPPPGVILALAELTPWMTLMGICLILQLFPDGHPVGRRWRLLVWATVLAWFVLTGLTSLFTPHLIHAIWGDDLEYAHVAAPDPFGWPALIGASDAIVAVGGALAAVTAVLSLVSLFVRRGRADAVTQTQLRWLGLLATFAFAWTAIVMPLTRGADIAWIVITVIVALGVPISVGIAIVKYRLFDIDVVIKKTVVLGIVATALVVLYLAVVAATTLGGLSRLVVGMLLLLVTIGPVLRAARSVADRVVYGKRASSYEVLAEFSTRMGESYATDDVLQRMTQVLADASGASSSVVWLRVGSDLHATRPGDAPSPDPPPVPIAGDTLPQLPADLAVEVRHQGELLGALSVVMPANDALDLARERLVRDLAAQAGLVLRNVRLIEELKASRQRLVAAQDEERRRLERNIHDGAQQQLVALAVKQRLVETLVGKDDERAKGMLRDLQTDTNAALEDLRDLARGIYPPLLADQGLVAALEAQARKAPIPIEVLGDGIGRFGQDIEAAVYFSCLEALQNIGKYAEASRATIALTNGSGALRFRVTDDGRGFDPSSTGYGTGLTGIADRLAALGGTVRVTSSPGAGTTVEGLVPIASGAGG